MSLPESEELSLQSIQNEFIYRFANGSPELQDVPSWKIEDRSVALMLLDDITRLIQNTHPSEFKSLELKVRVHTEPRPVNPRIHEEQALEKPVVESLLTTDHFLSNLRTRFQHLFTQKR